MQRHRDEQIGAGEHFVSDAVHPAAERSSDMGSIAVFQPQHEVAAVLVVAQHRPRPVPAAPSAGAGAAHRILAHRMGKRRPAGSAPGGREKRDARPAAAAQGVRLADRLAAGEAARRQNPIDDGPADPPQAAGSPVGKSCRCVHRYTSSVGERIRQPTPAGLPMVRSEDLSFMLFDRRAWRLHRDRAARRGCVEFLHAEVADRLTERLDDVHREFHAALDLGPNFGALSRALARRPGIEHLVAANSSAGFLGRLGGMRVAADPDLVPFRDGSFDLVVSMLELHWAGDLPGALVAIRNWLKGVQ